MSINSMPTFKTFCSTGICKMKEKGSVQQISCSILYTRYWILGQGFYNAPLKQTLDLLKFVFKS